MAIYYTNMSRKWKPGQTILFIHRTNVGDAVVGYGVVEMVKEKEELSELEKIQCEKGSWKRALEFKYVRKFEAPLPVRDTFLKDSKLRGRYFHGFALKKGQANLIINQAEQKDLTSE